MDAVPANGQSDSFSSKEATSNRPQLVVTLSRPSPPTGLTTATRPGVTEVDLSWASVPNVSGYTVYRSSTQGGPYTSIGTARVNSTPNYADRQVTTGSTYYYVVTATNAIGKAAFPMRLPPRRRRPP